ncbi:MAG: twin-arginine translocation signal domain-containing protein, partial [Burkholderiales bacterium]
MDRRSFIKASGVTLAGAVAPMFPLAAMAADQLLVGSILDLSGGLDIYGKPMADCMTLAVEEQNAAGGLLGKQ